MAVCMASVSVTIHGGEGVGSCHCKAPSFAMVQGFLLFSGYHCSIIVKVKNRKPRWGRSQIILRGGRRISKNIDVGG